MFCLMRYLTSSSLAAFFAGLVFAFFPYRMSESVHPGIVSTQWMPLYYLFLLRLVEDGHARHTIPAAFFFVLNALSGWHLMTFATILSLAYLCYIIAVERWRCSRAMMFNLVLLAGLICVIIVPSLYPLAREQLTTSQSYMGVSPDLGQGNDLIAFFLPAKEHPVWGKLVTPLHRQVGIRRAAYLGVTVVILSIAGGLVNWTRTRFWILMGLSSVLLSVGSHIRIGGHIFDMEMPWSGPIVWLLRHPFRFNLLIGFALAVTSGLGLSAVLDRLVATRPGWHRPFAVVMMGLLMFEYLFIPFPTTAAVVPDYYFSLAGSPGKGAILGLPMGRDRSKPYMYYQTVHNRPLVEGHVSRTPEDAYAFIEATPALRSLRACGEDALPPVDLGPILNTLREQGIEYVILHKRLVRRSSYGLWLEAKRSASDHEDEDIVVYSTQTGSIRSVGLAQLVEACVAVRSLLTGPVSVLQGETLEVPLEWTAGNSVQEEYALELALIDEVGEIDLRHRYEVLPGTSLMAWNMGARHAVSYPFQLDPWLPPGSYRLQATLVPVERSQEALLSAYLLDVQVVARPRKFTPPEMQRTIDAAYGADLRLLGYDLEVGEDLVYVTLCWQSLRRMEVDYKFFVHMYNVDDGALVAQKDVMPHDWAYPTTWWEVGEVVSDEIVLSVERVPPGVYRLGVGIYNSETGERLAIVSRPSHLLADKGRLILPEEVVR